MPECVCETCGARFREKPYAINRGRGRFCSRKCFAVYRTTPVAVRFWRYVDKTPGCWLWTGHTCMGYGRIHVASGIYESAHRLAWQWHTGQTIPKGMFICHHCDTHACVNPAHLFLGSPADNLRDAASKGRMASGDRNGARLYPDRLVPPRGERNGQAVLVEEQVREIRRLYSAGDRSQREIAIKFGVAPTTIQMILNGRNWRHIL